MAFKEKYPTRNDIYTLYEFYRQYKKYYEYYWTHQGKNITKEDIDMYIKHLIEDKQKLGGPIEALCMYAQVPKSKLFERDGTPKDINEIDVLKMIKEANYGETDY